MAELRAPARCSRPSSCCRGRSPKRRLRRTTCTSCSNMWVVAARSAVRSIITSGGEWVEIKTNADVLYQPLIVTAKRKFWHCVESGEPPRLFGI